MDKETLSNYGWIVICVLVLAVMIALATPFGSFVAGAVKSTTAGLFSVNQAALGSAGIDVNDMAFENCDHLETEVRNVTDTYTGDTCCKACGAVMSAGQTVRAKVPEGGKYTSADGTVYNPGDEMPENVTTGDKYTYMDYEYRYNQSSDGNLTWTTNENLNGWSVKCVNNVVNPGPILDIINGKPVTSLYRTFRNCQNLTVAPVIPDTIQNMDRTFWNCKNLTVAPEIPNSVINMEGTFLNCTTLTTAPTIPNGVTNIGLLFEGCTSLKTYVGSTEAEWHFTKYILPDTITDMHQTFEGCTTMITAPTIPEGVTNMNSTFDGCTSLVVAPAIPVTVTNMDWTFSNCTALSDTTNLVIPENVTSIFRTFNGCTSLTGYIEINTSQMTYRDYEYCFANVDFELQNLNLTGTSKFLGNIVATGINGCYTCKGTCQNNH